MASYLSLKYQFFMEDIQEIEIWIFDNILVWLV